MTKDPISCSTCKQNYTTDTCPRCAECDRCSRVHPYQWCPSCGYSSHEVSTTFEQTGLTTVARIQRTTKRTNWPTDRAILQGLCLDVFYNENNMLREQPLYLQGRFVDTNRCCGTPTINNATSSRPCWLLAYLIFLLCAAYCCLCCVFVVVLSWCPGCAALLQG